MKNLQHNPGEDKLLIFAFTNNFLWDKYDEIRGNGKVYQIKLSTYKTWLEAKLRQLGPKEAAMAQYVTHLPDGSNENSIEDYLQRLYKSYDESERHAYLIEELIELKTTRKIGRGKLFSSGLGDVFVEFNDQNVPCFSLASAW